jgi:transposase-like protein
MTEVDSRDVAFPESVALTWTEARAMTSLTEAARSYNMDAANRRIERNHDAQTTCTACGAPRHGSASLGRLGGLQWFRCRSCGWTYASEGGAS